MPCRCASAWGTRANKATNKRMVTSNRRRVGSIRALLTRVASQQQELLFPDRRLELRVRLSMPPVELDLLQRDLRIRGADIRGVVPDAPHAGAGSSVNHQIGELA